MKERKRFYLKKNVDLGVLEDLGFKKYGRSYFGQELRYNNLSYFIAVEIDTREINLYVNNYTKVSTCENLNNEGEVVEMCEKEEVDRELIIEEYLDIPEELFELMSNGYVEMRVDYEGK